MRRLFPLLLGLLLMLAGAGPAAADVPPYVCSDGQELVPGDFVPDASGTHVTAPFRIPESCGTLQITLATYAVSPDLEQSRLHDSVSGTFTGSADGVTEQLTAELPGCDMEVWLVVGEAEPESTDYQLEQLLLGDSAEGDECPTATPTAPLDPFGSEVTIQGERGVAELTVEPGCDDIEVSLVNVETGRDGRRLTGRRGPAACAAGPVG